VKLQMPFIQLPLAFDANLLAAEIAALGEGPGSLTHRALLATRCCRW